MSRRFLISAVAGVFVVSRMLAQWKRRQRREKRYAYVEARRHALDLTTEEEVEAYVERVIHEFRQEQRERAQALQAG